MASADIMIEQNVPIPGIKVDKDIPIPLATGGNSIYPWDQMEVGDSFFVAGREAQGLLQAARSHVKYRKNGKRFRAKTIDDGARIWRIA